MSVFFFFNDTATTEIYTLSLHDALPISGPLVERRFGNQRSDRNLGGDLSGCAQHQPPGVSHLPDHGKIELPFLEDAAGLRLTAAEQDHQHSLLSFSQTDLVHRHDALALRH